MNQHERNVDYRKASVERKVAKAAGRRENRKVVIQKKEKRSREGTQTLISRLWFDHTGSNKTGQEDVTSD